MDSGKLYVNGQWVAPAKGELKTVVNPATEETIGSVAMASIADCDDAIAAARSAFDNTGWRYLARAERSCVLEKFLDVIQADKMRMVDCIVAESGHSFAIALQVHFDMALAIARQQISFARQDLDEMTPVSTVPNPLNGGATQVASASSVIRKPYGVVAAITPFNANFMLSLVKLVPALLMGNTVVLKGSELTPLEVLRLGEYADQAQLPAGVLNIIMGDALVGDRLVTHDDVDVVSFTGSDKVGSLIMGNAAPGLKRLMLELGGKSASVVLADADLGTAALFGAANVTTMAGQGCGLCTRHIVHNSVMGEYVERLKRTLWAMPIGNPGNRFNAMGPLISQQQLERTERFVEMALEEGGQVACGGRRPVHLDRGYYYEPTLITGLSPDSEICQQEIFGPVIAVLGFDRDEEAISIANNSAYGLSGALFSADKGKALQLASRIDTGWVTINAAVIAPDVHAPFGGIKRSGFGKEWGLEGLKEFSYQQTLNFPVG
jgi:aldehyde dehydrogenase (NAD+)